MIKFYFSRSLILLTVFISTICYVASPINTNAQNKIHMQDIQPFFFDEKTPAKTVVVYLSTNTLLLKENGVVVGHFTLVTQGKPGSYYETIGGRYLSDFKEELHFSSLGHVYMPYSVHVFGNYFIHGIPYYPDGTKVSSAYSGGCIRLQDDDAKIVYDFITPSTEIVITRSDEKEFEPTRSTKKTTIMSTNMTRLMVAVISLESLAQDELIVDKKNNVTTNRKDILTHLFNEHDDEVSDLYSLSFPNGGYVALMNKKAIALGLTNTTFTGVMSAVMTTDEDYARFMGYITLYKSYLLTDVINASNSTY